ncbi:beta-2-glycoprotein 1 isoform X1 [Dicentrarchus labrax]|uniref:beta-2-glycoprotein 1 isoform X1 n=1 Tax=Dicentrarchus labrax TaxID=13489 RepID=UPI0016378A6B|nr:beta-2-glycoprotein 1 isoform X1 [Dicentrarchus labrax]
MEHFLTLFFLCPFVFFITSTCGQDSVCSRPVMGENVEMEGLQRYFSPGVEIALSCKQGYTTLLGPRKIVCTTSGEWTKTKFKCIPKQCPYPDSLLNGEVYYEDTVYQSTINYTCNEGFTLIGAATAECLDSGTWSTPAPECKPVSCGLAPVPKLGMVVYDRKIRGNSTDYGTQVTFRCLPPYAVFGNARAECTASGKWTAAPECRVVTCPPPENISHGYMSSNDKRAYDYMENIKYGCNGDYVIEGSMQIVCQQNGRWSQKPSCNAPCSVGIQRGRILYKGQKIWIADLSPNKVLHKELVSVYCMDKGRKCGYAVPTQCINGKLKIPECFEEPSSTEYTLHSGSLPSEIAQC